MRHVGREELERRLTPHLQALLPLPDSAEVREVPAASLLTGARIDVIGKLLYAEMLAGRVPVSEWRRLGYVAHLAAFSNGTFREPDGSKHSLADYEQAFAALTSDLARRGFDAEQSLVPVDSRAVIRDGAHRVAAAAALDSTVRVVTLPHIAADYDAAWFAARGVPAWLLDEWVTELCRRTPRIRAAILYPAASRHVARVRGALADVGQLVHEKSVDLSATGMVHLVRLLYHGEPWLGTWRDHFAGAAGKATPCFGSGGPTTVFFVEGVEAERWRAVKTALRGVIGLDTHAMHATDTADETTRVAEAVLNAGAVHFMNHATLECLPRVHAMLDDWRRAAQAAGAEARDFAVDGSAVMALYGLRDAADLDLLHRTTVPFPPTGPDIADHNPEAAHHAWTPDRIVDDPRLHFVWNGIKFAGLQVIDALKRRRGEGKDIHDVALMAPALAPWSEALPRDEPAPPAPAPAIAVPRARIVGLVPARNEARLLRTSLPALARLVDAIVYLDDASDDGSVDVVRELAPRARVERLIAKQRWSRDEPGDRNRLLETGRSIGGTHFVVLDADEMVTANLLGPHGLREAILSLAPGQQLRMAWLQLWRSLRVFRHDASVWTHNYKPFVFADAPGAAYRSEFIHTERAPEGLHGRVYTLPGPEHGGVMHFQFVNWDALRLKQAWYRCLERVRHPERSDEAINIRYAPATDERDIGLRPVPKEWFAGYADLDVEVFTHPDRWREEQIRQWVTEFGPETFDGLDIWDAIGGRPHPVTLP
jgi:hypothetical protein